MILPIPSKSNSVLQNAAWMARLCWAAYQDRIEDAAGLIPGELDAPPTLAIQENAACIFASLGEDLFIASRGSDDFADAYSDISYRQCKEAEGMVHWGFRTEAQKMWNSVAGFISVKRPSRIWIGGHSLGGPMAMLHAWWLRRDYSDKICGAYTFGCPRFADPEFSELFSRVVPSFRFVRAGDPVPHLPPRFFPVSGLRYKHVGIAAIIDGDGELSCSEDTWSGLVRDVAELTTFSIGSANLSGIRGLIDNHQIAEYVSKIDLALSRSKGG